ncbi:MAG: DUF1284 domain-containing protein [Oscillospiraceae bacterium]|jgi:hypothetical protein|nr:DUF1284 domain-containing protein [Oscillospiraceae bacterium]
MNEVIHQLKTNPGQEIQLSSNRDAICRHCPYNQSGSCQKSDEVTASDQRILALCKLNMEEPVKWDSLREKLTDTILTKGKIKQVCEGCAYVPTCDKLCKDRSGQTFFQRGQENSPL